MKSISVIAVEGIGEVKAGMDLAQVIIRAAEADGITFKENDILVVAQKIVSKAEGRFVNLREVVPTPEAYRLAEKSGKPPALCQLIINESVSLIRVAPNVIIAETRCGCVCANAGIDRSNTGQKDDWVLLLPENPDQSAKRIAEGIKGYLGFDVAVIINDTQGRPFRRGAVGTAIGVFGINPLKSYVGLVDRYGRVLHSSVEAVADEIAAASTILMGQGNEGCPVVIFRGYDYLYAPKSGAREILRDPEEDLFR